MVTVSILAVGIVLVLRSFLSVAATLDSGSNRIMAVQLLETKMTALELQAKEEGGIIPESKEEVLRLGSRDAALKLEVVPLKLEEFEVKEEIEEEKEGAKESINEVTLTLLWKEANRDMDSILVTYLKNKETEVE